MEAIVNQKILEQFVNNPTSSIVSTNPVNVSVDETSVTRMIQQFTMKTNDGNYFIKYGGFISAGSYNAIEVYTVDTLEDNKALYIFNNIVINDNGVEIISLKQDNDGRFYGIARYSDNSNNVYYYLVIFKFFTNKLPFTIIAIIRKIKTFLIILSKKLLF